jgi:hypothetical protein
MQLTRYHRLHWSVCANRAGFISPGVYSPPEFVYRYRKRLVESAMSLGLATVLPWPVDGSLIGYVPDYVDMYRRAGERPADLPVQLPTRFRLAGLAFTGRASNPLDRCKRFQVIHPPFLDLAWRKGSFILNLPSDHEAGRWAFASRCAFARDLCRHIAPALEEKAPGHFAACHFAAKATVAA